MFTNMLHVLVLFLLIAFNVKQSFTFQQSGYRLIHDSLVIVDYNKEFLEDVHVALFQYNETSKAFDLSGTLKSDLKNDLWAHFKIYQAGDDNHFKQIPGKYMMNLCEVQKEDTFGTRDIFLYGNVTDCPILKGSYYIHNYMPDESKFPPLIVRGKLMVEQKVFHGETYLGASKWLGRVENL